MQQNTPVPQQTTTTLTQKKAMIASVALFFALPLILLLRKKVGYRFMNPVMVLAMVVLLFNYASISAIWATVDPTSGYFSSLLIAALGILVLVVFGVQRFRRWKEIKTGIPWHTYSRGVSWLSFLPLSDSRIKRFADPIACALVGLVCYALFRGLSYYLLLAAASLFIFEAWDHDVALNAALDMLDSLVESEVMSENVEHYSQPNPQQKPLELTAGIPTGIAPDIQHQIERRRNRPVTLPNDLVLSAPVAGNGGQAGTVG